MHQSSMDNMRRCIRQYLDARPEPGRRLVVLDLGSMDIKGTYRSLFDPERFDYIGADLSPGPGVDLVLDDPYRIPLPDGSIDVVISGQMLEHNAFFWRTFEEKVRVMNDDGFIFMIAPSRGQIHRFPVDCYRFYPDAYAALARWTRSVLIDCWMDDNHWGDLVGVFRKHFEPRYGKFDTATVKPWHPAASRDEPAPTVPWNGVPGSADEERLAGAKPYRELLGALHEALRPELYLEIGVRTGASLALAQGPAIGVDPAPIISVELPPTARLIEKPSDEFFAEWEPSAPVDLGFIDGLHVFEQVLRDFIHLERHCHPDSVIVIDDIFPNHEKQARRDRCTRAWTGDVWKLHEVLRRHRPDLSLVALDTHPTGLLLVTGLDPASRVLEEQLPALTREWGRDIPVPRAVINREGAHAPGGPVMSALLAAWRSRRASAGQSAAGINDSRPD